MVAADMHGAGEEFGEGDFVFGAFELLDDGGLGDCDVVEDAEEAEDHAGEEEAFEVDFGGDVEAKKGDFVRGGTGKVGEVGK